MRNRAVILMVEDDKIDQMAIKRAFKKNNIVNPLYIVEDGEEALAFLKNEGNYSDPVQFPRPNLILLDINMPRMNGLELLRIIRNDENFKEIPVVMLTTSSEQTDVKTSFGYGVAGYLVKPVTFEKFADAIAAFDMYWTLSELP